MADYKVYVHCLCFMSLYFVKYSLQEEDFNTVVISPEELVERQKLEFIDALGYGYYDNDVGRKVAELKTDGQHIKGQRIARSGGSSPYDLIAGASGGMVLHVDKANVSSGVDILSSATLGKSVIIGRQQITENGISLIEFYIDTSVSKVTVQVQTTCCKPGVKVFDPAGHIISPSDVNVTIKANTKTLYVLEIANPKVGKWNIELEDVHNQTQDVEIRGSSLVNFGSVLSDVRGITVGGQPTSGSNSTYVKVTPFGGDHVGNWTYFVIKTVNGTVLNKIPLGKPKGRVEKVFLIPVVWPNKDVHVGVEGSDTSGNKFTREQQTLVIPLGVRLVLSNPGSEFITACKEPFYIPFVVRNQGPTATFSLSITPDNLLFKATISPLTVHVIHSLQVNGTGTVTLQSIPTVDQAVTVSIRASAKDGLTQYAEKTLIARCAGNPTTETNNVKTTTDASSASHLQSCLFILLSVFSSNFL